MIEYSGRRSDDVISVLPPLMQVPVAYHDFLKEDGSFESRTYLMVTVQGTPDLGYIGYVEYWESPNMRGGYAPDFVMVIHETGIIESAPLAFELAARAAGKLIDREHASLVDVELLLQAVKL